MKSTTHFILAAAVVIQTTSIIAAPFEEIVVTNDFSRPPTGACLAFQNPGPLGWRYSRDGRVELEPAKGRHLFGDLPFSEARWVRLPVEVPLAGDPAWTRTESGQFDAAHVTGLGIALDSWGGEPFTVWLDGLSPNSEFGTSTPALGCGWTRLASSTLRLPLFRGVLHYFTRTGFSARARKIAPGAGALPIQLRSSG